MRIIGEWVSFRVADITGQSLSTLEGSDFAWFDGSITHALYATFRFPAQAQSNSMLTVTWFSSVQFFAAEYDSVVCRRCRLQ